MIAVRRMTSADVDFGLVLKEQAGWNQTPADWRRFLALQPDGCWLAEWDGRPAGTVVVCAFGDVAWIAMMLVEASLRGRGLGRALMERALACAADLGARSVRLDATPLGQPLYERLGFTGDFSLTRYRGVPTMTAAPLDAAAPVAVTRDVCVADAGEMDRQASGADRRRLIAALLAEHPGWGVVREGRLCGFCCARPGSGATQVGPCVADAASGGELLRTALEHSAGAPVIVDVPDLHAAATRLVRACGLEPQRPLLRMTRGAPVADRPDWIWASSGGEKG